MLTTATALGLVLAAIALPGLGLARALGLGGSPLARATFALVLGRLVFALATLLLAPAGALAWLPLACALVAALAWRAGRRGEHGSCDPALVRRDAAIAALCLAAALLLVGTGVGRSGLADARGDLVFFGRDTTNDPLVYLAMAKRVGEQGLPLTLPYASGLSTTATYVPFAVLAGASALPFAAPLDVAFRALPLIDAAGVAIGAAALALRLGASAAGAALAGVLLLLGSEASFAVAPAGALFGRRVQTLDSWLLFGPYLLSFNAIAMAMQTAFAAWLLLADARARRGHALLAGALVASLFEMKLFAWAPSIAALAGVALALAIARPQSVALPRALVSRWRLAALAAVLVSLPSLVEKAVWAARLRGRDETGFALCPLCLPRYLANAAFGTYDLSFALFRDARASDLLSISGLTSALGATLAILAIVLGARWLALPACLRAWRALRAVGVAGERSSCDDAGRAHAGSAEAALAALGLALAALLGLVASQLVVVTPHFLNGAQFAWVACFGLWPLVAVTATPWLGARRTLPLALLLVLALASSGAVLGRLGVRAPVSLRVTTEWQALAAALARESSPGDVVLEPSMLESTDLPSPIPALTGRPVHLSLLSAVLSLAQAERERRYDVLLAVFVERDAGAAARAIRQSGARFVLASARFPLAHDANGLLRPIERNAAGVLYRVEASPPAP